MNLRQVASRWIAEDPDPETASAARAMLDDEAALSEHFGHRLRFGTAGMRGALGPGPNRMNRVLVRRLTAAIADVLSEWQLTPDRRPPGQGPIVVGYDARQNSEIFAHDAARILTGAGFQVRLFPDTCPTPLLAFATRVFAARAGIMITASHNPPGDNGYKVYGPDGAQIIPPVDEWIEHALESVDLSARPLAGLGEFVTVGEAEDSIETRYLDAIVRGRVHNAGAPLSIVYTPLHGVGAAIACRALARAGYDHVSVVRAQATPDGRFPTVAFPNPEEPGALDLALALAGETRADLVLANDPDADRIAAAIPSPSGGYRLLDGNEVGTLLAEDLLAHGVPGPRLVATTVVSSTLLSKIAAHHGVRYKETLTGFKWIARTMEGSERFVLGYEEALGVCAGDTVHDKDGISAAVLLADLAAYLKKSGRTLASALDDLALRHGVHKTSQINLVRRGEAGRIAMVRAMAMLRASPPQTIGPFAVTACHDLSEGSASLPPADLLVFSLGADRLLLRPSGTEPKLKGYIEVVEAVSADGLAGARARAELRTTAIETALYAMLSAALDR